MKKLLITAALLLTITGYGTEVPEKLSSDARIEVVPYDPNNVVPINGTVMTTTQLIFSNTEIIENIQNGDLSAWTSSVSKTQPYMLFIKPTVMGSDTNMTVVTNLHTYYFHLLSQTSQISSQNITYAIRFIYPQDLQQQLSQDFLQQEQQKKAELSAQQHPENYHWNYSYHGDKTILPQRVFDDGQFTYFLFKPQQTLPAIFKVLDSSGNESVTNYRRDDLNANICLVLPEVARQWTLRDGPNHVASIFKN